MNNIITYLKDKYFFIVPTILCTVLIAIDLRTRSLWIDEGASLSIASQSGHALAAAIARDGGNMLLYYLLLHVIIKLFGDGAVALRMPALVGGVLATLGITLVCAKLFNKLIAFSSGVLASISLPFIYWSQNVRSYTLIEASVIWSYYFMLLVIEADQTQRRAFWYLFGYAACTLLGAYMSFIAILAVMPQLLLLVQYRKPIKKFIIALAIDAVLCIPLAVLAIQRGKGQLYWIQKPSWQSTTPVIQFFSSVGVDNNFIPTKSANYLILLTYILMILAILLGVIILLRQNHRVVSADKSTKKQANNKIIIYKKRNASIAVNNRFAFGIHLILWWLLVPSLFIVVESWLGQSLYNPRYFLPFIPPLSVLICIVLLSDIVSSKIARYVSYAVFLVILGLRLASLVPTYGVSPENWEEPTAYLASHAQPGDCVAFYPADVRTLVVYYMQKNAGKDARAEQLLKPILPTTPLSKMPSYVEDYYTLTAKQISTDSSFCKRMWLISSHQGVPDSTHTSDVNYQRFVELYTNMKKEYPQMGNSVFGWSAPVNVTLFQR